MIRKSIINTLTALGFCALIAGVPLAAMAQSVQQSGAVTRGHVPSWATSGVVQDGGSSATPKVNALGVYGSGGCPISITSTTSEGTPSGDYVQGCLSADAASGVTLSVTPFGSLSTLPFNIDINGTTYAVGGSNWLSTILDDQIGSTQGSVIYRSGSAWTALTPGVSGTVLTSNGTSANPSWAAAGGIGTVTSVATGTGLTGGPITSSGTIALDTPVSVANGGTGLTTLTAHYLPVGNGTTAVSLIDPGTSGQCLTSNGASSDPTFQPCVGGGTVTSVGTGGGLSGGTITSSGTISLAEIANNSVLCNNFGITTTPEVGHCTVTGTGNAVMATSPTLTTPTLGVASATSVNKVAITAPATSATLTIADGTTLTETTSTSIGRGQYQGTATNDDATAGNIGEYVSSIVTSGSSVSLTTATSANITSISLTAGDWDVRGMAVFTGGATTTVAHVSASVSQTSATMSATPGDFGDFPNYGGSTQFGGSVNYITVAIPAVRVTLTSTTTIYFVANASFGVSTCAAYGRISARRAR